MMRYQKIICLLGILVGLNTSEVLADFVWDHWQYDHSMGLEVGKRYVHWENCLGKEHFAKKIPQISPYYMLVIEKHFGLKMGLIFSGKVGKRTRYIAQECILGSPPAAQELVYNTEFKIQNGGYLEALLLQSLEDSFGIPLQFFVSVGASRLSYEALSEVAHVEDPFNGFVVVTGSATRFRLPYKYLFRIGFGMEYKASKNVFIGFNFTKESNQNLEAVGFDHAVTGGGDPVEVHIRAKKAHIINLNLRYLFF